VIYIKGLFVFPLAPYLLYDFGSGQEKNKNTAGTVEIDACDR